MQIKHVKDRKKNLAFSVYSFFFYRNRLGLSKVNNFNEQYESFTQRRLSGVSNQHAQLQGLIEMFSYRENNEGADQTARMRGCFAPSFLACRLIFLYMLPRS